MCSVLLAFSKQNLALATMSNQTNQKRRCFYTSKNFVPVDLRAKSEDITILFGDTANQ